MRWCGCAWRQRAVPDAPPDGTRLFRREPSEWGVPRAAVGHAAYVLEQVQRDFGIGTAVRAIKWFREADASARDGDQGVFRGPAGELGYVAVAEPDVVWLRAELGRMPAAVLIRTVVHELCHSDQVVRGSPLPVAELEQEAVDLTKILCAGLA